MEKAMQKEIEEKKKRIRAAFDLFDKEKKECVIQEWVYQIRKGCWISFSLVLAREVSYIMRYLGAYPSEKDIIKRILPEVV